VLGALGDITIILSTIGAAVSLLLALKRSWKTELRREHNDLIGWHISVLGSTYAVILGFMLYAVWTNFEVATANAEAEANCLVNVVRSSRGLQGSQGEQIRGLARKYVHIMLTEEWPAMDRGEVNPTSHPIIEELWKTVTSTQAHSGIEQASLDHTFTELARMTEYRRLRQLQVDSFLPEILWLVLIVGAVVTIGSACLFGTVDLRLHLIQVTMLALVISSILVAIADINRPFQGAVHVDAAGFERALFSIGDSSEMSSPNH
jgi:Protein of unknown function (DUF4239)